MDNALTGDHISALLASVFAGVMSGVGGGVSLLYGSPTDTNLGLLLGIQLETPRTDTHKERDTHTKGERARELGEGIGVYVWCACVCVCVCMCVCMCVYVCFSTVPASNVEECKTLQ